MPTPFEETMRWLERTGTARQKAELARYGIDAPRAFGVSVGALLRYAKSRPKDHALAAALWKTGRYEARLLAAMLDDPARVTRRQMDAWARAFDNWGVCDTVVWHLFDHTPFAWEKARSYAASKQEFVKRAGFAMMAGRVARDRTSPDRPFLELLPLVERGAADDRHFVKKGVNWALRRLGGHSPALHAAAVALAKRLAASPDPAPRWIGADALRALAKGRPAEARARKAGARKAAAKKAPARKTARA
ncbi:MAG: DNA alkylation repair protein [Vicinamibacteria bacterium]